MSIHEFLKIRKQGSNRIFSNWRSVEYFAIPIRNDCSWELSHSSLVWLYKRLKFEKKIISYTSLLFYFLESIEYRLMVMEDFFLWSFTRLPIESLTLENLHRSSIDIFDSI